MEKINFSANSVWAYSKVLTGNERVELARNDEYGIQIFIELENSRPLVSVYADDNLEEERLVLSKDDCDLTIQSFYEYYLSGQFAISAEAYSDISEEVSEDDYSKEIERRECELDDAVVDFMAQVMTDGMDEGMCIGTFDKLISETKEAFLSFLALKMGLAVYRPTIIESDGEEIYIDYPYEFIEMNKKNPIKKCNNP